MLFDDRASNEINEMLIQVRAAAGNPRRRPHAMSIRKEFPSGDELFSELAKNMEFSMGVEHQGNRVLVYTTSDNI